MLLLRYSVAAGLALLMTLALLLGMQRLIQSMGDAPAVPEGRKIADIWQSKQTIEERQKLRKPDKPEQPEVMPPPPADLRASVDAPADTVAMDMPKLSGPSIGMGGDFTRDSDFIPVYVPQPDYPPMALRRGIEGYAVVEVTITTTGSVRDVKLLEESPPNKGFGKYALRAAEKLKYNPRVINGVAEEVPGVLYKFSFKIAR